jgi:hypothetical protein
MSGARRGKPGRQFIDAFCQQAFDVGITKRRVTTKEYFTEFLEASSRPAGAG